MTIPNALRGGLRLPAIAAPMFLASGPDLVVEVCRSGVVGTFPALNERTSLGYDNWLDEILERLDAVPTPASFGVNLIVHKSNQRLAEDLEITVRRKVPLVITSLGVVPEVIDAIHSYGGLVFHDVINRRHAEKAAEAKVDGIIAVSAGAGGHGGTLSPFALLSEIASFYSGALILSGAMSSGRHIASARLMGADMAYLGTRFLATRESMIADGHKNMIVASGAKDVLYTPSISGVAANFLRPSMLAMGLDPDNLPTHGSLDMANEAKAWKTIWSAGQGVGAITDLPPAAELCERLIEEYRSAMAEAASDSFSSGRPQAAITTEVSQ